MARNATEHISDVATQGDRMGELEEGELSSSGDEKSEEISSLKLKSNRKDTGSSRQQRRHDTSQGRSMYHGTDLPRGYRTPAGKRLYERRHKPPDDGLKFKYHATTDLIRKTDTLPNTWRYYSNSRLASPPPRKETLLEVKENVSNGNNIPNLMDIKVKKPLVNKQRILFVQYIISDVIIIRAKVNNTEQRI